MVLGQWGSALLTPESHSRELLAECSLATKQLENQPCLHLYLRNLRPHWCLLARLRAQFNWERALRESNGSGGTAALLSAETSQKPLLHWAPATRASDTLIRGEFRCRIVSKAVCFLWHFCLCPVFPTGSSTAPSAPRAREGGRALASHTALIRSFDTALGPTPRGERCRKHHCKDAGVWFKSLSKPSARSACTNTLRLGLCNIS